MDYYFESNNSFPMPENTSTSSTSPSKKKMKGKSGNTNNTQKLSTDPQSVAARERRHRISHKFKTLQSLVPGGSKLDTVSMLDEAIHYVNYLKTQIWIHENMINFNLDDHNNNNNNVVYDHHYQDPDLFIYSQSQQQLQPEFSSVPLTLTNYCYEGTSFCDGYTMQQY